jgi:hypothetical protein
LVKKQRIKNSLKKGVKHDQ